MAEFRIETNNVTQQVIQIKKYALNIGKYSEEIENMSFKEGLGSLYKSINNSIKISKAGIDRNTELMSEIGESLEKIIRKYQSTEQAIFRNKADSNSNDMNVVNSLGIHDGRVAAYDNKGQYGGDQGDLIHNKSGWKFWFFPRVGMDNELFDYVKKYSQYKDYTDDQIVDLFEQINNEGCGYVAFTNNIFTEYDGKEEEFERDFGFPMYDDKGELNYNRLLIDFYAETDNYYYLNGEKGESAFINDLLLTYRDSEEEFFKLYGMKPFIDDEKTKFNPDAVQAVLDEYKERDEVYFESDGTTFLSLDNRVEKYLNNKGISYSSFSGVEEKSRSIEVIKNDLDNGRCVNIGVSDFDLYNESGEQVSHCDEAHFMTITGVTEDGRYIVSSWGEKYYIKPNELNGQIQYTVYDISVKTNVA